MSEAFWITAVLYNLRFLMQPVNTRVRRFVCALLAKAKKQAPSQIRAAEVTNRGVVSHKWKEAMKPSFPMTFHAFKTCSYHTKQTIDVTKSSRYREKY